MTTVILGAYGLFITFSVITIIVFIIRRQRKKKEETFDKRKY